MLEVVLGDWRSSINGLVLRCTNFVRRHFPERQILLKEERKVRCLNISTAHQLVLVSLLAFGLIWTLAVTFGYVHSTTKYEVKKMEIASRKAEVDGLKKSYQNAFIRIDEIETLFSGITCEISDIQDSLLKISVNDGKHGTMPRLSRDAAGCRGLDAASAIEAASQTAIAREKSIADAKGSDFSGAANADAEKLQLRVSMLAEELMKLRASHDAFLQNSVTITEKRIDRLQKTLSSVGLGKAASYGQGGPYLPANIGDQAYNQEGRFDPIALFNTHADRYDNLNKKLHSLPLAAPIDDYDVTSPFGSRNDPINAMTGMHEGVDMGASLGTNVLATGDGIVVFAGKQDRYGLLIELSHGSGVKTRYAHLSRMRVKIGDHVRRGSVIGAVGETGRTTGPHLHYEVRVNDIALNPMRFISAGENVFKNQ